MSIDKNQKYTVPEYMKYCNYLKIIVIINSFKMWIPELVKYTQLLITI